MSDEVMSERDYALLNTLCQSRIYTINVADENVTHPCAYVSKWTHQRELFVPAHDDLWRPVAAKCESVSLFGSDYTSFYFGISQARDGRRVIHVSVRYGDFFLVAGVELAHNIMSVPYTPVVGFDYTTDIVKPPELTDEIKKNLTESVTDALIDLEHFPFYLLKTQRIY